MHRDICPSYHLKYILDFARHLTSVIILYFEKMKQDNFSEGKQKLDHEPVLLFVMSNFVTCFSNVIEYMEKANRLPSTGNVTKNCNATIFLHVMNLLSYWLNVIFCSIQNFLHKKKENSILNKFPMNKSLNITMKKLLFDLSHILSKAFRSLIKTVNLGGTSHSCLRLLLSLIRNSIKFAHEYVGEGLDHLQHISIEPNMSNTENNSIETHINSFDCQMMRGNIWDSLCDLFMSAFAQTKVMLSI